MVIKNTHTYIFNYINSKWDTHEIKKIEREEGESESQRERVSEKGRGRGRGR